MKLTNNNLQAGIIESMKAIIQLQAVKNTLHPRQQMPIMSESTIVIFFELHVQGLSESLQSQQGIPAWWLFPAKRCTPSVLATFSKPP